MMTEAPQPIEYASPIPASANGRRDLLAIACCFGVAWLVGMGIGYASYDPFDDDLLPWLLAVAAIFGTPCGAVLSLIALAAMRYQSRRRGSAS